jgi:hypothetical protein
MGSQNMSLINYFGHFKSAYQLLTFMQCRIWDIIGLWMANEQKCERKRAYPISRFRVLGGPVTCA